ncbi:hypothetical protein Mal64_22020 [Pseudobythopirellula maris]|uniref:Uncharacterized protein n=1 Tax=Pseudobythopirellula maris TaxID=2527991 RepID=A0A5C5ZML0_9BACT|nr:hypothetical protein [Pseudobythopirellula maris]TWT88714.1 hypothetical protein Mal64_22020 [Pseudobythopirellula maris]
MRNRNSRGGRRARFEALEDRRVLATLTINSDADAFSNVNDGSLTLREAIDIVNGDYLPADIPGSPDDREQIDNVSLLGTNDRIVFDSSLFGAPGTPGSIDLIHGELEVEQSVVIDGGGYDPATGMDDGLLGWSKLTIDAGGLSRAYNIYVGASDSVTVKEISMTGGNSVGGGTPGGAGGAINAAINHGELILDNLQFLDNSANRWGGAMAVSAITLIAA